ncbi:MAG: hypothetical protein ABJL18_10665 [Hyphomicrobiales bacterium]
MKKHFASSLSGYLMSPVRSFVFSVFVMSVVSSLGLSPAIAGHSKSKQNVELQERIELLELLEQREREKKALLPLEFGSRGKLYVLGVSVNSSPLTEAEINEIQESEGN